MTVPCSHCKDGTVTYGSGWKTRTARCATCAGTGLLQPPGVVQAMKYARWAIDLRMRSDEHTGDPFDEDLAEARKRLDAALGGQSS